MAALSSSHQEVLLAADSLLLAPRAEEKISGTIEAHDILFKFGTFVDKVESRIVERLLAKYDDRIKAIGNIEHNNKPMVLVIARRATKDLYVYNALAAHFASGGSIEGAEGSKAHYDPKDLIFGIGKDEGKSQEMLVHELLYGVLIHLKMFTGEAPTGFDNPLVDALAARALLVYEACNGGFDLTGARYAVPGRREKNADAAYLLQLNSILCEAGAKLAHAAGVKLAISDAEATGKPQFKKAFTDFKNTYLKKLDKNPLLPPRETANKILEKL